LVYIIAGIIVGAILISSMLESKIGEIVGILLGTLMGIAVGVIVDVTIGSIIGRFLPTQYVITRTTPIVALNDNSATNGSFFLGCGKIGEKTVYKYVINTSHGKQVKELEEDKNYSIYIKEYKDSPKIEYQSLDFINQKYYWFAFPPSCGKQIVTFYVPECSVTNEFNIDLE